MATDDLALRVGMRKLEIEAIKVRGYIKQENPFSYHLQGKGFAFKSSTNKNSSRCICLRQKRNYAITKKKHKLLREPMLRLSSPFKTHSSKRNDLDVCSKKFNPDNLYLHSLVDTCNQLSISTSEKSYSDIKEKESARWWKCDNLSTIQSKDTKSEKNSSGTCSQQALNPPCDVTIDELASYFDTLVHIPKKMSSMAEMMYI